MSKFVVNFWKSLTIVLCIFSFFFPLHYSQTLPKIDNKFGHVFIIFISTLVHSFESFRFLYISLNGIQCLTKWILHLKNNDDFLMDNFWKDLTLVTTLFFLLPFEFYSKVNNTKTKKGENLQICSKTWKSENCLDRGSNPGRRWQTFLEYILGPKY